MKAVIPYIIVFLSGAAIAFFGYKYYDAVTDTVNDVVVDTVKVKVIRDEWRLEADSLRAELSKVPKVIEGNVNVDSIREALWVEAKEYFDTLDTHVDTSDTLFDYVAEVDTLAEEDSISAWVRFISPIPLHPKSYFDIDLWGVERDTVVTIEKTISLDEPLLHETSFVIAVVSLLTNIFLIYLLLG